jgi:Zn-dependent protease
MAQSPLERLRQLEAAKSRPMASGATQVDASTKRQAAARGGGAAGAMSVLVLLAWKFKAVLLLGLGKLKLVLGFFKIGFTTAWTMALTVWVYAQYFGAAFAAGLVALILVHELGHGAAARRVGIAVGVPVFIPFFGAAIAMKERPRNTYEHFIIAAGGPLFGSMGGALTLAAAPLAGAWGGLLYAIGFFALVLNLFNLIPFWRLDGAAMVAALDFKSLAWGTAGLAAAVTWSGVVASHVNPMALGVVAVSAYAAFRSYRQGRATTSSALEKIQKLDAPLLPTLSPEVAQPWRGALCYFGLAGALSVAVQLLHDGLPVVGR